MQSLGINNADVTLDRYKLVFGGREIKPSIRRLGEMHDVLLDNVINSSNKDNPIYYMYRSSIRSEDEQIFEKSEIRYDITVLNSTRLGRELNKTLGHFHPIVHDGLSYPEVYEVLSGEALYILQRQAKGYYSVKIIHAGAGEKVLIPPNYGHVTVNPIDKDLVMANLVSSRFSSLYEPVREKKGMAVYILEDSFKINSNYDHANIEIEFSKNRFKLPIKRTLYDAFLSNPYKFDYLNEPKIIDGKFREEG